LATLNVESDYFRAISEGVLLPILMYHDIYHDDNYRELKSLIKRREAIESETFFRQMQFLYINGFKTVPLDVCTSAARGYLTGVLPEKAFAITFDDGYASNYTIAMPILQHFGFTASFFVTTGKISADGFLTNQQINKLAKNNMTIGSHTVSHRSLIGLDEDELYYELFESKMVLESILNRSVPYMSLPGGHCNDFIIDTAVRAGYEIICTSNANGNESASNVLTQSIGEMVPLRLCRYHITKDMDMDLFQQIVLLDEWEIARKQHRQVLINTFKQNLTDGIFKSMWETNWMLRSCISRA